MERLKQSGKVIITDTLGVLLIIASILFGWVPGPGGIPLFIAGLGLLAINHDWAARWQTRVKNEGLKFFNKLFSKHPAVRALYDLASTGLVLAGLYLINVYTRNFTLSLAIICIFTGIGLFLGNRERLQRLHKRLIRR